MNLRKIAASGWLACLVLLAVGGFAPGQVCNVKVVTDASPDYYDIESMIRSITANWETPKEKCWALFYWHHLNRRQMAPLWVHGTELTDPIMQWNDYGFTMCSTICGINCSVWEAMGFKVRHWEIQAHTVPEIFYDGRWHMYDNSMSALYTLCDGVTIAGVEDIGKTQGCPVSGGKAEYAHIAKYHCLNSTGKGEKACLTGADCNRELKQEGICFNPNKIQNCGDLWWDRGHRYIFNLHAHEVYTRYYHRLDVDSPNKVFQAEKHNKPYDADPAYFVPNDHKNEKWHGKDGEASGPRYHIRGNGIRTYSPSLAAQDLGESLYSSIATKPAEGGGLQPAKAGEMAEAIFSVEGANVITSMTIKAALRRQTADDVTSVSVSTTNGMQWKEVWRNDKTGEMPAEIKLIDEVNGSHQVLVKVQLLGNTAAGDAQLKQIAFETITEVNSKAQPRLNLGKNTIYVGTGDQSEAAVFWPDLRGSGYKQYVVEEQNVVSEEKHPQSLAVLHLNEAGKPGFVVFKLDTPRDMTRLVYGGRLCNKGDGSKITYEHSFDDGKTWSTDYTLDGSDRPWDVIKYVTVDQVPADTHRALFRYAFANTDAEPNTTGLFNVRMEADYKPAVEGFQPIEVTWTWNERQEDYSVVPHSHTQLIDKVPCTYSVNVGGVDHPEMESLRINLKGAAEQPQYGYASPAGPRPDGQGLPAEAEAKKYVPFWASYGTNFAEGKPYTVSQPSLTNYNAGDKEGQHKLTDGVAWCSDPGGLAYSYGLYWGRSSKELPVKDLLITVDLRKPEPCGGFRIHLHGYPAYDALKGEMPYQVEVLTSSDNQNFTSRGFFNLKLRWKDLPVNYMWPDSEQVPGYMFDLRMPQSIEARYVQFKINSPRSVGVTEVQALDSIKYEPFDLRVALPNE